MVKLNIIHNENKINMDELYFDINELGVLRDLVIKEKNELESQFQNEKVPATKANILHKKLIFDKIFTKIEKKIKS